jgi:hypothetical protein
VVFLKQNFLPAKEKAVSEKDLEKLVAHLDSQSFETRDNAMRELLRLGDRSETVLQRALRGNPSLEVKRRIQDLLEKLARASFTPEEVRVIRGVEVLERIGTPEAREWLSVLSKGAPNARTTQEAQAALQRANRD